MSNIISRAIGISFKPKTEWAAVDAEPATTQGLITGYVAIMAAIPAIGGVVGSVLMSSVFSGMAAMGGMGMLGASAVGLGLVGAIVGGVLGYVVSIAVTFIMGLLIDALAPSFGAEKNPVQAMKVAAYAPSAIWLAGAAMILPPIGGLIGLAAMVWTIFLVHWGLVACMKPPAEKAIGFSAVVIILWVVIAAVLGLIVTAVIGMFAVGAAVSGAAAFM